MEQARCPRETVPITPSLIERLDFADLGPAEQLEMIPLLFRLGRLATLSASAAG